MNKTKICIHIKNLLGIASNVLYINIHIQIILGERIMLKKVAIIGIIVVLILPFQSTIGLKHDIHKTDDSQIFAQNPDLDIVSMINQINYSILYGYLDKVVSFGIRHVESENVSKASGYINEEFQKLGLDSYIEKWEYPRYSCQNVVGTLNGTNPSSDAVFILTAHLDTIGDSVGANDDGSGVATLLTIANITSKFKFNHTIKFVIVSGEEIGTYGSFEYAKKAYNRNENIILNLNIDMIGNSTCGNIIQAYTPERSHQFFYYTKEIEEIYENYIDMQTQLSSHDLADSNSFVDYGYDTITFSQPRMFDYPLHSSQDTPEKITYPYFENVTKLILATTAELANKEIDVQVRFVTPKEGMIYIFNKPIHKLPGFNLHYLRIRAMTYLIGRSLARINITTNEEIISVMYKINGITDYNLVFFNAPYDWKIQKPGMTLFRLRGIHKIGVYVHTITGKTAYDEMDIYALTPI